MQKATCDDCGHHFTPKLRERKGYQSFKCPGCHRVYPVASITAAGLKLRDKLGKERLRHKRMTPENSNRIEREDQYMKIQKLLADFQKRSNCAGESAKSTRMRGAFIIGGGNDWALKTVFLRGGH